MALQSSSFDFQLLKHDSYLIFSHVGFSLGDFNLLLGEHEGMTRLSVQAYKKLITALWKGM